MADPAAEPLVFHVELKQGFNVARRFNLSRAELEQLILVPWSARNDIELDDRVWLPARSKLKILQGPVIDSRDRGMGRGWTNAERAGEYVTDEVLGTLTTAGTTAAPGGGDPAVEAFKQEVVDACGKSPLTLGAVAAMAGARNERLRVSEQLALAERAVWELLHQQRIALFTPDDLGTAPQERWQPVLLAWASWSGPAAGQFVIEPVN
jgi:hypothetical protein